ncbi:MAG TPA: hypothetical protein VIW25_09440 [Nitrososphaeraceae archaeon]
MMKEKSLEIMAFAAILATAIASIFISPSAFAKLTTTTTNTSPFPQLPTPSSNPSTINMTSENKNAYTISSGFTRINNFVTTYTITGGIDSIKSSSDLLTSTIIKDFDGNANIGYVKNGLSSQATAQQQQLRQRQNQQQPSLPNPFVAKSVINQTISDAVTNAISSASVSFGGYLQIKCIFGTNLADYHCNSIPVGG